MKLFLVVHNNVILLATIRSLRPTFHTSLHYVSYNSMYYHETWCHVC